VFHVGVAAAVGRDMHALAKVLHERQMAGQLSTDFIDRWYEEIEEVIEKLHDFPERHGYAPERKAWHRDVRQALLQSGYRLLYEVHGQDVWVMRLRHQRQQNLGSAGPGTGYRPELGIR
jgi:plasmid stabilization system protein ParE